MKPLSDCLLYTFVDTGYLGDRSLSEVARQLCDGGSDLVQLRAKHSTPDEIRRMAEILLPITRAANVGLVINDHPAIALEVGAEFVHLGQEDLFETDHNLNWRGQRPATSNAPGLGVSSHAPEQAQRGIAAGADYIAVGPVYATGTKPGAKPVTLDYVRWAKTHVKIPWFAIGGIHLGNLEEVLAAGAHRVCVVSAILNSPDIAGACQKFKERLRCAR
jgi:thiamine-phosphate pyrophosphorylase